MVDLPLMCKLNMKYVEIWIWGNQYSLLGYFEMVIFVVMHLHHSYPHTNCFLDTNIHNYVSLLQHIIDVQLETGLLFWCELLVEVPIIGNVNNVNQCFHVCTSTWSTKGSAAMLAIKRSAVVTPDVNLRNPFYVSEEKFKWGIYSDFENQGRWYQKSTPLVISGRTKRTSKKEKPKKSPKSKRTKQSWDENFTQLNNPCCHKDARNFSEKTARISYWTNSLQILLLKRF